MLLDMPAEIRYLVYSHLAPPNFRHVIVSLTQRSRLVSINERCLRVALSKSCTDSKISYRSPNLKETYSKYAEQFEPSFSQCYTRS